MKKPSLLLAAFAVLLGMTARAADDVLRIGMIGLDTSHVPAFTGMLNDTAHKKHLAGARVVVAFPGGSPDIESSWNRVKGYTEEIKTKWGVRIVDSVAEVVANCDAIMIESVDGRAHLPFAKEVFGKGKPVYIDKPLGGNLREVLAIAALAEKTNTPLFSSSSLRYGPGLIELKEARIGRMLGAISYGPCALEPHHTDLYWYGVHATESLYTVMGTGCEKVSRVTTADTDVVTGVWKDGRTGVVYGVRNGKAAYRVTAFGTTAVRDSKEGYDYAYLMKEILAFFKTRKAPVPLAETVELMAYMEAADESKRAGGALVSIADVIAKNSPKR
ncbi:MAG: Gfo/Idh/MocA family oxidoreductase [Verrucomicrobia bacterium]|nr:Gfo/Idh/MocA family oxidoreductase [Verrucomicrobiota bacterium]